MSDAEPHRNTSAQLWELVDALNKLRDALVQISLLLQDAQFHLDTVQRQAAAEQLQELLEKINPR